MKPRPGAPDPSIIPPELQGSIAEALAPVGLDPARVDKMRGDLLARVRAERPRFVTVRGGEGSWVPLAPKVALKILDDDGSMRSFLIRIDAGGRLAAHDHTGDEVCVVLQGDCHLGGEELAASDYHLARGGTRHGEVWSRGGCVLFIRAPVGSARHG